MSHLPPDIFEYFDYRKFLADFYQWKKAEKKSFSYRYIALKVGMDHSLLVKVFKGQRHIATDSICSFISLLHLDNQEGLYFQAMVRYEKCRKQGEKQALFEELLSHISAKRKSIAIS